MTVKQALPLNGHHVRKHRNVQPAYVGSNGVLPPSQVVADAGASPELVAAVQRFHDLKAAEREQARLAAAANAKAEAAELAHQRERREVLASGGDPSKVKSSADKHKAEAAAHMGFYNDARNERAKLGHTLGPQLEAEAPALFATVEERITAAADSVRAQLAAMKSAWNTYGEAFELRRWLSHIALDGGNVGAFHGQAPMPKAAADALTALDHALAEVDRLKADEAEVLRWRAQEEAAVATQRRIFGGVSSD